MMMTSSVTSKIFVIFFTVTYFIVSAQALILQAFFSQSFLKGRVEFIERNHTSITIKTKLKPEQPDRVWSWKIHEYPVDYRDVTKTRCSKTNLGKEIIDLTEEVGYVIVPGQHNSEFESKKLLKSFWGKSLVFEDTDHNVACSTILSANDGPSWRADRAAWNTFKDSMGNNVDE